MNHSFKIHLLRWTLFCLLLGSFTPVAHAQNPITDDEVNAVAKDLYCPVCESTPLDVCPTQACKDWREVIRTKLEEGQSKEEIMAYFAELYGNQVLAEPPQKGFSLVVWLLPAFAVLFGGFFFARYLNRLKRNEAVETQADSQQPTKEDDYLARIEKELQERL